MFVVIVLLVVKVKLSVEFDSGGGVSRLCTTPARGARFGLLAHHSLDLELTSCPEQHWDLEISKFPDNHTTPRQ